MEFDEFVTQGLAESQKGCQIQWFFCGALLIFAFFLFYRAAVKRKIISREQ